MPDATITSTASTFGTISGVFSADQSTISGTITGIVPGTLTGSVGVPGPAGPAGAPGQGVPAGGTAGQYLQKTTTGVDYATDWVTINLGNYALLSGADFTGRVTVPGITGDEFVNFPGFNIVPTQTEPTDKVDGDLWIYDDEGLTPSKFRVFLESETQNIATESWVTASFAPKASPVFTGDPRAPTPASGDNDTSIATTAFVKVQGYITSAALTPYLLSSTAASTYQTIAGMSSYLTTSAAASTYAVIAAGQPTSGTVGQVLTKNSGANWDSSWQTLIPGDRYLTSSTTSNTVSNGNKTFTIGTGLSYTPTQNITISYDASNHMHGEVLTYNSGTGVLTVDINHHTGSGTYTAWVVNVGGVTPATSVTWGSITGTLGSQTDLATALNAKLASADAATTYAPIASPTFTGTVTIPAGASISGFAPLASPAFTGTPSLPTGTTGVTQTAGNNTTALATTAFVQQEVPAASTTAAGKVELATNAETITSNSVSVVPALDVIPAIITRPENRSLNYINSTAVSGSGSASSNTYGLREIFLSSLSAGRSAYWLGVPSFNQTACLMSRANNQLIDFSKKIWVSGKSCAGFNIATNYMGDSNTMCRVTLGGYNANGTGDMVQKGIGWKKVGGTSPFFTLTVHNGTTLTDVATTVQQSDKKVIDWVIYSDGTGNVTFYIDGAQAATTSAGPIGTSTAGYSMYREQVEATATPTVRGILHSTGGHIYTEG